MPTITPDAEARLVEQIHAHPDEHLVVDATEQRPGVVLVTRDEVRVTLHRRLYAAVIGTLPARIRRTCAEPRCQNPHHWEPGSTRTEFNVPPTARVNATKTHCPRGHEYTPENTYRHTDRNGITHRRCKACTIARSTTPKEKP